MATESGRPWRGALDRAVTALTGEGWRFDPVGAGARVVPIVGLLAAGEARGAMLPWILAAGGAFTVGFGAELDLRGSALVFLVAGSLAIGASAIAGSIAAAHDFGAVGVAAVLAILCGLEASRGAGRAWIALHCGIAGVIATSYPASWGLASERALVIVAGGLCQAAALLVARTAGHRFASPTEADPESPRAILDLALGMTAAMAFARALSLPNGYWAPMTTLLVLRPGRRRTFSRALARTVGTLGGAALASAAIVGARPGHGALVVLVGLAAFGTYLFQKATYGTLSAFVTLYVVFVLSLGGLSEERVAVARIFSTALGAGIGLVVQLADALVAARFVAARRA